MSAAVVAVVPASVMREAWRAVRAAIPALADVPWPLVEAAFGGGVTPSLVAQCTDGDATIVITDRVLAARMRQWPCVRWVWDDSTSVSVRHSSDSAAVAVTVNGSVVGPVREGLIEALVTLGAEVQP